MSASPRGVWAVKTDFYTSGYWTLPIRWLRAPAVSLLTLVWTGVGPPATHLLLALSCRAGALPLNENRPTFTPSLSLALALPPYIILTSKFHILISNVLSLLHQILLALAYTYNNTDVSASYRCPRPPHTDVQVQCVACRQGQSNEKDGPSWHPTADVNSHATSTLHLETGLWIRFGQMHIFICELCEVYHKTNQKNNEDECASCVWKYAVSCKAFLKLVISLMGSLYWLNDGENQCKTYVGNVLES